MKPKSLFGLVAIFVTIQIFLLSCTPSYAQEINENVAMLDKLDQGSAYTETLIDDEPSISVKLINSQPYVVTAQKFKMAAEFNEQLVLDPTSDVIWVGAIIDAETIPTGQYVPITLKRAPLTLSISLENIAGEKSKTISEPTLSTIREAIGEILEQDVTGATPARITFMVEEVYSEEHLKIAVGSSYSSGFGSVKGQFDFSNEETKTRLLVKFLQVYYTIDIDIPEKPSDFFDPSVDWDDLANQISENSSPMYISTITYGRMALFSIESNEEATKVAAAVNAAFGGYEGSISTEHAEILRNSKIQATIIGGSGTSAVGAINGFEGIKQYITQGGDYDKNTAAAPLSYKLRYLKDSSIGSVILSSEYAILEYGPLVSIYQDEVAWTNEVNTLDLRVVKWDTNAKNIEGANEVDHTPQENDGLGPTLTWEGVTDNNLHFSLHNPRCNEQRGLVYWDTEGFPRETISIGDIDNCEDDDFVIELNNEKPQFFAIAFYFGDSSFRAGETMTVTCETESGQEFSWVYQYNELRPFFGVISPLPVIKVSFNEKSDDDDIYIKDFRFGIAK